MQRVRVGLTGLSIVFLLVLLAAAAFGLLRDENADNAVAPASPAAAARGNAGDAEKEPPREPLAELGVTPGGAPEEEPEPPVGNAATPLPAPAPPAAR